MNTTTNGTQSTKTVFLHLQRSQYLLAALADALADLNRSDLLEILALANQDISSALDMTRVSIESQNQEQKLRVLTNLQHLSRLGGQKAERLAIDLAGEMSA